MRRLSVAMDGSTHYALAAHLLRSDGQEDLCLALWRPSTGRDRDTRIVQAPILPEGSDRAVHGNASFSAEYVLRAAGVAGAVGAGLAFLHSHPGGVGWQGMSTQDRDTERRIANLVRELTGMPLLGLTLAGDGAWSGRSWDIGIGRDVQSRSCESVRVLADGLRVTFDDAIVPVPQPAPGQVRTLQAWGAPIQSLFARLRVLVVGAGSVGMSVAEALARAGVEHVDVMDFDSVEVLNLDRIRGATACDARLARPKVFVARRVLAAASTAARPRHQTFEWSVCEPEGLSVALDYDVIFSCVDRPWPRHVLNTIAFADVIPVIDGGLRAFRNHDDSFKTAYWTSAVVGPGRTCLACLGQYDPAQVQLERDGSLDDPKYIEGLPPDSPLRARQNVAAFSAATSAALLLQFVAFVARPSEQGDPGPLRFDLRTQIGERIDAPCDPECFFQHLCGCGDGRPVTTGAHVVAEGARRLREAVPFHVRLRRAADGLLERVQATV